MTVSRRWWMQAGAALALLPRLARADAPLTRDVHGRLLAPVRINERGPFEFVIDTAANHTMISTELAADFGLRAQVNPALVVQGSTGAGTATLGTVRIASMETDDLRHGPAQCGLLSPAQLAGAQGLLAADLLQGYVLDLQLRAERLAIYRDDTGKAAREPGAGAASLEAARRFGNLLALTIRVGRVPVQAILDTGAARSVGNLALLQALGKRRAAVADRELAQDAVLTGIDGDRIAAVKVETPALRLGAVALPPMPILYADLPVFSRWSADGAPTLLLGMDHLGRLGRVLVDYRRARVHVWS